MSCKPTTAPALEKLMCVDSKFKVRHRLGSTGDVARGPVELPVEPDRGETCGKKRGAGERVDLGRGSLERAPSTVQARRMRS